MSECETMIVQCPKCLNKKTINKTNNNIQVRCSVRDSGCGEKYYTKFNTVLFNKTNGIISIENIDGMPTTIDLSILRAFYKIFTGRAHRGTKEDLLSLIIVYLRSELGKL